MKAVEANRKAMTLTVIEQLTCFILFSQVRALERPAELPADERPEEDSPEAMIMRSDLMSGGLEPHLFSRLE